MNGYRGPRRMRFKDGRTGLLSPFGVDSGGVYEVTDSTAKLAEWYREAGMIEYLDAPVEERADEPPVVIEEPGEEPIEQPAEPDDEE